MTHLMRFAIIDHNILTCVGLQQILSNMLPMAEFFIFKSVDELKRQNHTQFLHFFVSSRIYFEHVQFFKEYQRKTIVLVNGDMTISNIYTLNVCQNEKDLVRDIMVLQSKGHGHAMEAAKQIKREAQLSPRETEVAILLCKGFINKEIADKLEVGITTIISHRKNIMEKLHARSLADIIIYCIVNGLVNVEEL